LGVLLGVRLSEGEAAIVPPRTLGVIYGEPHFEGGVCDGFYVRRRKHGEFVEAMCESDGNNAVL
jgi:hypothetical protein